MSAPLPSFSFVMPAYNAASHIEGGLASLINACAPGDQIIVVDDGSKDATPVVLANLVRHHPELLNVVRQENQGQAAARCRGVAEARNPYVLFLDADDEILADTVVAARASLAAGSIDVLCCDFKYWNGESLLKDSEALSHPANVRLTNREEVLADSFKDAKFYMWSKVYKREVLAPLMATLPQVRYFEDIIGIPMILNASSSFLYLPRPLVKYRQHAGNMTTVFSAKQCQGLAATLGWLRPIVQGAHHARLEAEFNMFCVKVMYWVLDDWLRAADRGQVAHATLATEVKSTMTLPMPDVLTMMKETRHRRLARRIRTYCAWPAFYLLFRKASFKLKMRPRGPR